MFEMALTVLFTIALLCAAIALVLTRSLRPIKYVFLVGVLWYATYGVFLLGVSFTSTEKTLGVGQNKRFCGFYLDCHMMVNVTDVKRSREYRGRTAKGEFAIVDLAVLSDAQSARLKLKSPEFQVVDDSGRVYYPESDLSTPSDRFTERIAPASRLEGKLVFDLPANDSNQRLDVRSSTALGSVVETLIIGDEDSLFHKRTFLSIEKRN